MINTTDEEFQKCGEIMFAAKRNKIALCCNFCHQMFKQLQAFMRHLQIKHAEEVKFTKQIEELEVYAIEELINQTGTSCVPDVESDEDEIDWLNETDIKWLDEGVTPSKPYDKKEESEIVCDDKEGGSNISSDEEYNLNVINTAILKALKDCDVSFNLTDTFKSTKCSEEEQVKKFKNTSLKVIHNDCKSRGTHEKIEYFDIQENNKILLDIDVEKNNDRILLDVSKELKADRADMTVFDTTKNFRKENQKATKENIEQSPIKCMKKLLQSIEEFEDVDILLDNLESDELTGEDNKLKEKLIDNAQSAGECKDKDFDNEMDCWLESTKVAAEDSKLKENAIDTNANLNVNAQSVNYKDDISFINISHPRAENSIEKKGILRKIVNKADTSCLKNIEDCLQDFEIDLDKDVLNGNTHSLDGSIEKGSNILNSEQKFKDLEKSLTAFKNNKAFYIDLEKKLKVLNDCEDDIKEDNSAVLKDKIPNEDITKALADALDNEDLELISLQLTEEVAECCNNNVLDLLENELLEKDIEKKLYVPNQQQQRSQVKSNSSNVLNKKQLHIPNQKQKLSATKLNSNNVSKVEEKLLYSLGPPSKYIDNKNFLKTSKFHKTISKARKKTIKINKSNRMIYSVLRDSNCIAQAEILKDSQKCLKEKKGKLFKQRHQFKITNSVKRRNTNQQMPKHVHQNKTPNKENTDLNIQNVKKETFTPNLKFVNTERGNKTPIKSEEMFFKQSPKTPEYQELLQQNITPPNAQNFKQSPKTKEKHKTSPLHQKPIIIRQNTPSFEKQQELKQSPKYQKEQIPKNNNNEVVIEIANSKRPQKSEIMQSNGKPKTTTKIVNNVCQLYNSCKKPLTPPARRLKKVAIVLQRCTPDKLANMFENSKINTTQIETKQIGDKFKVPKQITIIPDNSIAAYNQCDIIETPIKTVTYMKQNFTNSSVKNVKLKIRKDKDQDENYAGLINAERKVIETLQKPNKSVHLRQRIPSIDTVNTANNVSTKQSRSNTINKTLCHNNLDSKSYAVTSSSRKKEVLQRMRNSKRQIVKSIGSESIVTNKSPQPRIERQEKHNVIIENVRILPNLDQETLTPLIFNNFKKPLNNSSHSMQILPSFDNMIEQLDSAKSEAEYSIINKRRTISTLLEVNTLAKRQRISPIEKQNDEKSTTELEKTHLDLSESCVDFLQRDLKASRLNVESLLNSESGIAESDSAIDEMSTESQNIHKSSLKNNASLLINDLFENVTNENNSTEEAAHNNSTADKDETSSGSVTIHNFDKSKDIDLLAKFGLKIIKIPEIEDVIFLEERDEINEKAKKFAKIYKNYQIIWSTKNSENQPFIKEELIRRFKEFLAETNSQFDLTLSMIEIRRLVNLINFWFVENVCSKFIKKCKISDSVNRYLTYFFYLPKIVKRFYCEYCEEHFTAEHKYYTHRMIHTGASFPYECQKCCFGYKTAKQLKGHESRCNTELDKTTKCLVCKRIFKSGEILYEHSKAHLKDIYCCIKCNKVFASTRDLKNHLILCRSAPNRMEKPYMPRPRKTK